MSSPYRLVLGLVVCLSLAIGVTAFSNFSGGFFGAIYTTNGDGERVNQNLYASKSDVYLNGGPQNANSQGLPDGTYFYQVTDPSGATLLSEDVAYFRQVAVVGGVVRGDIDLSLGGGQHAFGTADPTNGSVGVQLIPYADTPNAGGEYKVWLIRQTSTTFIDANDPRVLHFQNNDTKTDNFKVKINENPPPSSTINIIKYHDLNGNGTNDAEPPLDGFSFNVHIVCEDSEVHDIVATTGSDGPGLAVVNIPSDCGMFTYEICEQIPAGWSQTEPNVNTVGATLEGGQYCYTGTFETPGGTLTLPFGDIESVTICGAKYYDANANGVRDNGEVGIAGYRIMVEVTYPNSSTAELGPYTTDADGNWCSEPLPVGTTYMACEVIPGTGEPNTYWQQTGPLNGATSGGATASGGCWSGTATTNETGLDFGNICLQNPSGGFTLGYWSNKNGQAVLAANDPAWRNYLNSLWLRKADGNNYDVPATAFNNAYGNFRTWLLNATAVNMAYMLSAQLAANELDGLYKGLSGGTNVLLTPAMAACYGSNIANIGTVRSQANAALQADGYTPDGDPNRAHQECLKNILDALNNNLLPFIHSEPCDVVYP